MWARGVLTHVDSQYYMIFKQNISFTLLLDSTSGQNNQNAKWQCSIYRIAMSTETVTKTPQKSLPFKMSIPYAFSFLSHAGQPGNNIRDLHKHSTNRYTIEWHDSEVLPRYNENHSLSSPWDPLLCCLCCRNCRYSHILSRRLHRQL